MFAAAMPDYSATRCCAMPFLPLRYVLLLPARYAFAAPLARFIDYAYATIYATRVIRAQERAQRLCAVAYARTLLMFAAAMIFADAVSLASRYYLMMLYALDVIFCLCGR